MRNRFRSKFNADVSIATRATAMTLNPLANPKGVKLVCELCQKPAHVQCTNCRVTYYCGQDHQRDDWLSIHEKICPIVTVLRSPQRHANSEEEREHWKHQQVLRKKHIIDVALQEGKRYLYEGHYVLAIPAALEALKFLTEVYGETSIQLTSAYLILAETAICQGQFSDADQYLSQAQWSVLKTPDCEAWLKSQLHRNLGQLAAAKNSYPEARRHFAEDIYQSSVAYGPESTKTSGGYYHLGRVFMAENKPDIAISLHDQVISIWNEHLSKLVSQFELAATNDGLVGSGLQHSLSSSETHTTRNPYVQLDVAERAEAGNMLHNIRELREQHTTSSPSLMTQIYHTLAMLHLVLGEIDKSELYAVRAVELVKSSTHQSLAISTSVDKIDQLLELLKTLKNTTKIIH